MIRMMLWYFSPTARDWTGPFVPGDAHAFHRALPGYAPTPLVPVPEVATELGVGRVLVKDESSRLGLPAFKVLGASWACRQVLEQRPGVKLVTATDGNHGRAVARMAAHFGVEATVFAPEVMLRETAARIAEEGAKVVWVDGDYDAAVRRAAEFADEQPDRALVQDTAWDGYEQVPGSWRATRRCWRRSTPSSRNRRTWWWSRSGSDHSLRRSCGTTDAQTPRTQACSRSNPTPPHACWRA